MHSKKRIIWILISLIAIAIILKSCWPKHKTTPSSAVSVTTAKVLQKDMILYAHAIGTVQPFVTVSIRSRVEGELLSVGFKEGQDVKEGQVLFEVDPHPYQVALDQSKATLARDQAQLDNLQKQLSRFGKLVQKGYISKQEFDAAEANLKAQQATVLVAKAMVQNAELNLSYCTIKAPINGRTGNVLVNKGNVLKPNDTTPLVVINQVKPVFVAFSLPEKEIASLKTTLKLGETIVTIQPKNASKPLTAIMSFIDNAVDKNTGMILMKAIVDNAHEEIWPGQFVDVTLPLMHIQNALLLPTRAIQEGPEGAYVFVVNQDGTVAQKTVQVGAVQDEYTIVMNVKAGTVVVATGQSQLVDGVKVTLS